MALLLELFLWLDGSYARFLAVAWGLFGLWFLAAILPYRAGGGWRRWNPPSLYAGLMLLMMGAFRWPGIGLNLPMPNPDESQMLAGALTLLHHGQYWGVIDCGSAGPLDLIPLLLPRLFGLPLDYTTARSVGLLLLWGSCVFAWLVVRRAAGDRPARLVIMPMACCLAFTHDSEFVQYTSEQAPIFFCALAVWLGHGALDAASPVRRRIRLTLAGGLLILLPFAKLQAAPFTVGLALCLLAGIALQQKSPWQARLADAAWLAGGALLGLGLMALTIARSGGFVDFYETFWLPNLHYAQGRAYPWSAFGAQTWTLVRMVWRFDAYLLPALALLVIGLARLPWLPPATRRHGVFGAIFFVLGLVAVAAPGRAFQHYLQFLILPTSLFIGLLYATPAAGSPRAFGHHGWLALLLLLGVGPQVFYRSHDGNPYHGRLLAARAESVGPVAREILAYARPGDTLTVWGWMPTFHVQTQLPQGTRDAHTERQITPNLLRPYFRQRCFDELAKNRPTIFVDAVGEKNFGYHNRHNDGHKSLPWLGAFIADNYVLAGDIETARIYVRKDRWAERHP